LEFLSGSDVAYWARFGHAAMSDLSPLCAQKRKLNVTTIWIALAICGVALIGAAALWG
jgi:hypothetical protein